MSKLDIYGVRKTKIAARKAAHELRNLMGVKAVKIAKDGKHYIFFTGKLPRGNYKKGKFYVRGAR